MIQLITLTKRHFVHFCIRQPQRWFTADQQARIMALIDESLRSPLGLTAISQSVRVQNIGLIYSHINSLPLQPDQHFKALSAIEECCEPNGLTNLNILADIYRQRAQANYRANQLQEAAQNYQEVLKILRLAEQGVDKLAQIGIYDALAKVYYSARLKDQARRCYEAIIDLAQQIQLPEQNVLKARAHTSIATICLSTRQQQFQGEQYLSASLKLWEQVQNRFQVAQYEIAIRLKCNLLRIEGKIQEAAKMARQFIASIHSDNQFGRLWFLHFLANEVKDQAAGKSLSTLLNELKQSKPAKYQKAILMLQLGKQQK